MPKKKTPKRRKVRGKPVPTKRPKNTKERKKMQKNSRRRRKSFGSTKKKDNPRSSVPKKR